jgi:putative FmdB family regulatory protein
MENNQSGCGGTMPNYEYICQDCHKRFEAVQTFSEYGRLTVHCPTCNGANVRRRIGRVRMLRSADSRMADLADPAALDLLEEDPRAMGKMLKKMRTEIGEEVGPEFDEVVSRLEKGQRPEDIEKDLPELGSQGDAISPSSMDDYSDDF